MIADQVSELHRAILVRKEAAALRALALAPASKCSWGPLRDPEGRNLFGITLSVRGVQVWHLTLRADGTKMVLDEEWTGPSVE